MATYQELTNAENDSALQDKVRVAMTIAAIAIQSEDPGTTNHANRLVWAREVLKDPRAYVLPMLRAVLAINEDATLSTILNATDAAVQTNVDDSVDLFASGAQLT